MACFLPYRSTSRTTIDSLWCNSFMRISRLVICGWIVAGLALGEYKPVGDYDPQRNAEADIREAVAEAARTKRHVLVDVGGKWCGWCRILDKFFDDRADLKALRDRNYLFMKVNFSPENENKTALSKYPAIPGYPHFFVLDGNGRLLQSQGTSELEEGSGYNLARMKAFLERWAPKK